MSCLANAVGAPPNAALAEPDDAPAATTTSSASGNATIAAAATASHLTTGSSLASGDATGRTHPALSPCKRPMPKANRGEKSSLTTISQRQGETTARSGAHAPGITAITCHFAASRGVTGCPGCAGQ